MFGFNAPVASLLTYRYLDLVRQVACNQCISVGDTLDKVPSCAESKNDHHRSSDQFETAVEMCNIAGERRTHQCRRGMVDGLVMYPARSGRATLCTTHVVANLF